MKDACGDNKPPVPPSITTPICHHTCAEYAAMNACSSTWNSCIPDYSAVAIGDSCKESCGHPDCGMYLAEVYKYQVY